MFRLIVTISLFFLFLSGCDKNGNSQKSSEIIIKNRLQKSARESVSIVVNGKKGDKLYANSQLIKSFENSGDANISLRLVGEDGLKVIVLEMEDKEGNIAKPVTLKIHKDTTPPKLKLLQGESLEIVVGAKFQDPGFVVMDNIDKNVSVKTFSDLNSSQAGLYTIKYVASDSAGNSVTKVRTIRVLKPKDYNFAPSFIGTKSELRYKDHQEVSLDLHTLFNDKNGDTLHFNVQGLPPCLTLLENGVIQGSFPKDASRKSPYILEVAVTDSGGKTIHKVLKLIVENPAPKAKGESVHLYEGKHLLIDILKNDSDADGDTIKILSIDNLPKHGKAKIEDGKIEYQAEGNYTGSDSFSYTIQDSDGATASAKVALTIKKFKNIPVVYLSQDTWDRDNYTLIAAAKKMQQRELIDLHAVDITGKDIDGKVSNVFQAILGDDVDIPVLINHSFYGRVTPTTRRFPELSNYVDTIILDEDAPDSTDYILSDLEGVDKEQEVVYIVGGHLHNFASLLLRDEALVNEKVDRIVIATGWEDRIHGKPEMNLSEGVAKETTTSKATKIVFSKFKGEIVMASDPDANYPVLDTSKMDRSSALWYFIAHGKYNDQQLHVGDIEALLYGAVGENWYGHHWVDKRSAKCSVTNYGAVKLSGSGVKCSYLDNMNTYYTKAVLEELLYK